jgi:hypothetical protein
MTKQARAFTAASLSHLHSPLLKFGLSPAGATQLLTAHPIADAADRQALVSLIYALLSPSGVQIPKLDGEGKETGHLTIPDFKFRLK